MRGDVLLVTLYTKNFNCYMTNIDESDPLKTFAWFWLFTKKQVNFSEVVRFVRDPFGVVLVPWMLAIQTVRLQVFDTEVLALPSVQLLVWANIKSVFSN